MRTRWNTRERREGIEKVEDKETGRHGARDGGEKSREEGRGEHEENR